MLKRSLICTDLNDSLYRLASFVPDLAKGGMELIVFLHVASFGDQGIIPRVDQEQVEQAKQRLAPALQQIPTGVDVKIEIQTGKPIDAILRMIQTYDIDGVILGTPTKSLLSEKLFGSTTINLCQRIEVPVLILRPQLLSAFTSEEMALRCQHLCRSLLIPYDGSQASKYLVEQVQKYLQSKGNHRHTLEHCLLSWVIDEGGRREIPKDHEIAQAQQELESVKAYLTQVGLSVDLEVRQGNPLLEILEAAENADVSAIAIASDSLGRLREWSTPSFTGELFRRSWHPVLFFPKS